MAVRFFRPGQSVPAVPAATVAVVVTMPVTLFDNISELAHRKHTALADAQSQIYQALQALHRTDAEIDAEAAAIKAARPTGSLE